MSSITSEKRRIERHQSRLMSRNPLISWSSLRKKPAGFSPEDPAEKSLPPYRIFFHADARYP
jgi:hypothetical protein